MSKNRKTDKAISILLSLLLAFGVFSVVPFATGSQAAVTGLTPLPTTTGATLTNGNRYVVSSNTDIGAVANTNGLIVADNATVLIYIPSGVTLNVSGGAGSANTGGKAGIYLPGSSTLIVTGGGTLNAYGGSGGAAGAGGTGANGNGDYYGGTGGAGGTGAGGGGAGI
ncbi:MAG: hypothetical protein IJK02_04030, partial [Clostridia bacterium]|nr:hypothetical protein [Clostridia bacterium]